MREIKFRAKRLDNGEWVNGSGLLIADDFCVIDRDTEMYVDEKYEWAGNTHFFRVAGVMCDLKTIGQYTGLKDKNGKEVYEGDIVKSISGKVGYVIFLQQEMGYVVVWDNCDTCLGHRNRGGGYECDGSIEVISNIYDNPDFVEE